VNAEREGQEPAEPPERFPGYDVLSQRSHWDPVTRSVVLGRLHPPKEPPFFTETEESVCRLLLDRLLVIDRRDAVPVFELIDQRLAAGSTDGWYYDDMPPDEEVWHRTLAELAAIGFAGLGIEQQNDALESIRTAERFAGLPAPKVWGLWLRYACTAYYSHPSAWSEIGFGGPAYPRGYRNLGLDRREPWEVREVDAANPIPWIERVEAARRRHR
jgi:hypothetical protein